MSGLFDWISNTAGNIASIPAIVRDKIILDGIGGSGSTAGYTSGNVSIGTPGLDVMGQARQDLNEQLAYLEKLRKMIEERAIEAGASPEEAQKTAVETVPVNTGYGVSGTGGDSGVPAGADIFTSTIDDSTIEPESIEEDTEPTLADIIGEWLERQEGPVTQEKILDVLGRYGRTPEDFNEAVADVEGIPSFEDFVSETDLQGEGDTPTTDEEVEESIDDSTTQQPSVGYRPPPVFRPDEPTPPESPLEKPDEPPTFIMPTLPEEEVVDEEFNGLLAISAPNRTTTEVLAPDLFKLDNNIPLVGKLTQYTPMTAPQYLLSGISQRYRV